MQRMLGSIPRLSLKSTSFVATDRMIDAEISTSSGEANVVAGVSQISTTVNFDTSRANPSWDELVHPSSASFQYPLGPDATSPTSAHTEQHISRASNISATVAPSRRARKKASHTPAPTHAGPVAGVSSLETVHEESAVSECSLRLSVLDQESQVGLTSASAGEVPMGPRFGDATVTVQNSLMDVVIENVSVANERLNSCHETSEGVITTSPPSDVVVLDHTLVQDGALPSGYESDFAVLEPYIFPGADRQLRRLARLDNVSASVALHHFEKELAQREQVEKKATEQFLRQLSTNRKCTRLDCRGLFMKPPRLVATRKRPKEFAGFQSCARSFAALPRQWESYSWKNPVQNRSSERAREQLLYVPGYAWRGDILHGSLSITRLLSQTVSNA